MIHQGVLNEHQERLARFKTLGTALHAHLQTLLARSLCCTAVLMVLLVGCGTASQVVRLDTGRTGTLVFHPHSDAAPVELDSDAFKRVAAMLSQNVQPPAAPGSRPADIRGGSTERFVHV